jgi:hypothetical protein
MDSIGMGGRFAPESVDELDRNMHISTLTTQKFGHAIAPYLRIVTLVDAVFEASESSHLTVISYESLLHSLTCIRVTSDPTTPLEVVASGFAICMIMSRPVRVKEYSYVPIALTTTTFGDSGTDRSTSLAIAIFETIAARAASA